MPQKANSSIPPGYVFAGNPQLLISGKGKDVLLDISKKCSKENPDMYAYDDFYCYAIADVVDKYLSTLHTKVIKKAYDDAYYVLEGLTVFMVNDNDWCEHDDGERIIATDKAYGALAIALFRGLDKQDKLNTEIFPGLAGLMKTIAEWGESMADTPDHDWYLYIKYLGEQIVKGKTAEDLALDKARQQEWIRGLPKEEQREVRAERRMESKNKPWYEGGKDNHTQYAQTKAWKEYKDYLSGDVDLVNSDSELNVSS